MLACQYMKGFILSDTDLRVEIADRLAEERIRLGYSQVDFAEKINLSREGLRLYERGQRAISAETLSIASTLGLDVQYVLMGIRSKDINYASHPVQQNVTGNNNTNIIGNNAVINNIKTQRHIIKAETKPGIDHISEVQKSELQSMVNKIVELEKTVNGEKGKSHRSVYSTLNRHCKVSGYSLILKEDYEKAEGYLLKWLGRLSKLASAGDPVSEDRKRAYAYIKINSKGNEAWLAGYVLNEFGAESIKDLNMTQLNKTKKAVSARKKNRL